MDPQLLGQTIAVLTTLNRGGSLAALRAVAAADPRRLEQVARQLAGAAHAIRSLCDSQKEADIRLQLTSREREVLEQLQWHQSVKQIARTLHISPNTVKTHLSAVYRKLGVTNRADAVARARQQGLF